MAAILFAAAFVQCSCFMVVVGCRCSCFSFFALGFRVKGGAKRKKREATEEMRDDRVRVYTLNAILQPPHTYDLEVRCGAGGHSK